MHYVPEYFVMSSQSLQSICIRHLGKYKNILTQLQPKFHLARHVTSRYDSTRSTCRAHAFWLCRARRTAPLDTLVSTRRTCRVVSRRDESTPIWQWTLSANISKLLCLLIHEVAAAHSWHFDIITLFINVLTYLSGIWAHLNSSVHTVQLFKFFC